MIVERLVGVSGFGLGLAGQRRQVGLGCEGEPHVLEERPIAG